MSFDTYNGPAPWEESKKPKSKNKQSDLSVFNTTNTSSPWEGEKKNNVENSKTDLSIFNTDNGSIPDKKKFIYFNPEGLISTRKHRRHIENVLKKHLEKKRKVIKKRVVELKLFKSEVSKNNTEKLKNHGENTDVQTFINDARNDLKLKQSILQKDKEHNYSIKILKQQGRTKREILNILNNRKKPKFIKYEKKYDVYGLNKKIVENAVYLVKNKDTLGAINCTDWVDRLYKKIVKKSVYDTKTTFDGIKHIKKGTGIGVKQYAPKTIISSIIPGEHIIVDKPVKGKYGLGKTHSVIALTSPKNGLLKVASFSGFGTNVRIEEYDLYGLNRAKDGKPIRIQGIL